MKVNYIVRFARIFFVVAVIIVVLILIIPRPNKIQINTTSEVNKSNIKPVVHSVTLTTSGFIPKNITMNKGEVIIWTNKSGKEASVNSADHPTHKLFPVLNLGSFDNGQNLQTRIYRTGELKYVNHLNPSQTGTITVK